MLQLKIISAKKMFKLALFLFIVHKSRCIIIDNENIVQADPYPKNENARIFIQTYHSRNPVILLLDDVHETKIQAANFLKTVYNLSPSVRHQNFMLMKFNVSDATPILESTKHNPRRFEQLLTEKRIPKPSSHLGVQNIAKTAVFFGILNSVQNLPPNSGVVVFIQREIEDEVLAQHALQEALKKNIQIFVVGKKEPLLQELASRTEGVFFETPELSTKYYNNFLDNIHLFKSGSVILSRVNLQGEKTLSFPIDSDVTGIHLSVTPEVSTGILITARGAKINILDSEDVAGYSAGSFANHENGHQIHINTTQDVGFWRLRIANARALFNVTIFAHTKLTTNAVISVQNLTANHRKKFVKLGLTGPISSINNISFVRTDGSVIVPNVKFALDEDSESYQTENLDNIAANEKKELNIDADLPKEPFYAVIDGKDGQGKDFRRLSYVTNREKEFSIPPITIEMGLGSELITQPGRQPQIYFEVTNNGNTPTLVRFHCRDDKSILLSMVPWYRWINPQETATVRLTLTTRTGQYQDMITFTASGTETVNKQVIVDVGQWHEDRRDPDIYYYFKSDCTNVLLGSCEDGTWRVEIKAKDTDSGLLQVSSHPRGLYFPNGFTAGTTEEVTGYYSESCCNPDLKVIAFDRQNNRYSRHLNAYRANLGPGAIAAIVLGVLLLIVIIVAICVLCRMYCIKTTGDSYDLPVYRGPSSRRS